MLGLQMLQKGYVSVSCGNSHGQIHYRRVNPSIDPLGSFLLLHQNPSSSRMWESLMEELQRRGCRAVAIDLPGFGESFSPDPDEFTVASIARYVSLAIPELDLAKPSVVVGHHLGAAIAMELAVSYPRSVEKLALWGVPILEEAHKKHVVGAPNFEDEELKDVISFWKRRNKVPGKPGYKMPTGIRVARLVDYLQSFGELPGLDNVKNLVDKITQPTLCVCGDNELLKDATVATAEKLANGKLCFVADAGIDVQDEFPEEFANALIEFIST